MTKAELAQLIAQSESEMLVAQGGWRHAHCDGAAWGSTMSVQLFDTVLNEHAGPNEDGCRDATVERWRDGKKLVPEDWKHEGEGSIE
jgi:hypothetical protein